jgi:1-acyl-sn-glycerol-3-phosphate acyltransferase
MKSDVEPPEPDQRDAGLLGRAAYRLLRPVLFVLSRVLFRIEVHGAERLPAGGAYVIAPIHRSGIDFLIAALVTRRRTRWMAKSNLWNYPVLGWAADSFGAFAVHRGEADRAALRTARLALRSGQPLVIFPEGTRREGEAVHELFDGASWLAHREGVPLVPVGIAGTDKVMPRGAKLLRPAKVVVVVGAPIYPDKASSSRVSRVAVTALTGRLALALQEAFDQARALRSGGSGGSGSGSIEVDDQGGLSAAS